MIDSYTAKNNVKAGQTDCFLPTVCLLEKVYVGGVLFLEVSNIWWKNKFTY
jgi:hypothetical protein